jgi:large subunit ribosomal protein L11
MSIITKLTIYIRANSAQNGPPLGTILGNIGVNTVKFCKEFNDYTKDLPDYFRLKVNIIVTENKNFTFTTYLPSIGFLIFLLKKEEEIKDNNGNLSVISYILLEDFLKLAKFKFPNCTLLQATKMLKGSLLSSNIIIKI